MKKEVGKAIEVLRMMYELNIKPDIVTYNTAMYVCTQNSRYDLLSAIFKSLGGRGLKADVYTWNIVLNAYARRKKFLEMFDCYQEMIKAGTKPNLVTYTTLIKVRTKLQRLIDGCSALFDMFIPSSSILVLRGAGHIAT